MAKPRVLTKCVANNYTGPNERIIEFSSKSGGGLIAFRETGDRTLLVSVYRLDPTVQVTVQPENVVTETALAVARIS
jgi:hypothetical protein